jgi:hypothetical protein
MNSSSSEDTVMPEPPTSLGVFTVSKKLVDRTLFRLVPIGVSSSDVLFVTKEPLMSRIVYSTITDYTGVLAFK